MRHLILPLALTCAALAGCQQQQQQAANDKAKGAGDPFANNGSGNGTPINDNGLGTFGPGAAGLGGLNTAMGEGDRSIVAPVYFGFDKADVSSGEQAKVNAAATWLKSNPNASVILEGNCDWRGTAEYNMSLGDRRAQSVKAALIGAGIPEARINKRSLGSEKAVANGSEDQMANDRRVDFAIVK